jgi:hypothetical protein
MLRSQIFAPVWGTSVELDKVSCRVKMVSKYQVDTVFVHNKAVFDGCHAYGHRFTVYVGKLKKKLVVTQNNGGKAVSPLSHPICHLLALHGGATSCR